MLAEVGTSCTVQGVDTPQFTAHRASKRKRWSKYQVKVDDLMAADTYHSVALALWLVNILALHQKPFNGIRDRVAK